MQFGATWSWIERWSKCWSSSAKKTPSISLEPAGLGEDRLGFGARERGAEPDLQRPESRRPRPTVARWIPRCVTPLPHSWIET